MPNRQNAWQTAHKIIMGRLNHGGIRLSTLHGVQRAVAQKLIDRGQVHVTRLSGDWLIEK